MQACKKRRSPIVRWDSVIPLVCCFILNSVIYFGVGRLAKNMYHHDFTFAFDRWVPVVPQWVWIYVICYVFWAVNYILVGHLDRKTFYRFVTADMTSRLVCMVFFLFLPTTNIRPEILGENLSEKLLLLVYRLDDPVNLFPSIHCLVSWFCYIGIRGRKEIPVWYRGFSCIFALLVCASTQFTKQHYIVDVLGGILLAELCWFMAGRFTYYKRIQRFFEKINKKISGKIRNEKVRGQE